MSGTERGAVVIRLSILPADGRDPEAVLDDVLFVLDANSHTDEAMAYMTEIHGTLAAALGCTRVEALAVAREARADLAALRTERDEAVRLLRACFNDCGSFVRIHFQDEVAAFLARTDTGGQEPPVGD